MQTLSWKQRIAPFLALLDARYLPLLLLVAPQAWTVGAWLSTSKAPLAVAVLGGAAFEFVYVGAVAWAEHDERNDWTDITTLTALVFSITVAIVHYWPSQHADALIHAGFPIVAYAYTMQVHRRALPWRSWFAVFRERDTLMTQIDTLTQERDTLYQQMTQATQDATQYQYIVSEVEAERDTLMTQLGAARHQLTQQPTLTDTDVTQIGGKSYSLRQVATAIDMDVSTFRRKLKTIEEV